MTTQGRDPRRDPRPGDEIGVGGLRWRFMVNGTRGGRVLYAVEEDEKIVAGLTSMTLEDWKVMFATAEIVKVAP